MHNTADNPDDELAPKMLARKEIEVAQPNVRYVAAGVFVREPEATQDVVCLRW